MIKISNPNFRSEKKIGKTRLYLLSFTPLLPPMSPSHLICEPKHTCLILPIHVLLLSPFSVSTSLNKTKRKEQDGSSLPLSLHYISRSQSLTRSALSIILSFLLLFSLHHISTSHCSSQSQTQLRLPPGSILLTQARPVLATQGGRRFCTLFHSLGS